MIQITNTDLSVPFLLQTPVSRPVEPGFQNFSSAVERTVRAAIHRCRGFGREASGVNARESRSVREQLRGHQVVICDSAMGAMLQAGGGIAGPLPSCS